ncbi:hypothetical protein IAQ61_000316 [Plenodomus lingam]|uniref:Uncharacterized protein n=1 Tax=Leptosphaeria maculans (strain JN3 / isolate v23.1.3 / race Av1-4-5-6-7-8) TaxID=985895 RepID=E5R5G6_LEPMJ|nr:hypothetical protein LEMA_P048420.1 [Plenodomus lingam JN3]KAH9881590.1 hypothetical protein IAQ61_000316 [Plenodomus lingam]CBX92136.1 hypothetical protein LEMA_P048420.1 [Plenodomus lingam JN3]
MEEAPRSASRSRRSYPNLQNLSLAPLTAKYPLDASAPPSPEDRTRTPRTSYIAQKSAPTTPGILSLSQSRSNSRNRAKKAYAYDGYFIDTSVREIGDVPKAKSTSTLLHHPHGVSFADQTPIVLGPETKKLNQGRHHTRKRTAPLPAPRTPLSRPHQHNHHHKRHTEESKEEWLHRAGLAIASESRDSKGQGWLISRESSTSLVGQADNYDLEPQRMALLSGHHITDPDYPNPSFFSPHISHAGSRIPSRVHSRAPSARQSRRTSRVGSRVDLLAPGHSHPCLDPAESTPLDLVTDDPYPEPDFLGAPEEDDDDNQSTSTTSDPDEVHLARLAREPAFGIAGWLDRFIGWSLFSVTEDGEASSDDDDDNADEDRLHYQHQQQPPQLANLTRDELKLRREVEAKRRKLEREGVVAAAAVGGTGAGDRDAGDAGGGDDDARRSEEVEEVGGWHDAAWLLSVASKALLS